MKPGDLVQTPFGKGTVQEVRNNGRLLVLVGGRALVLHERDAAPAGARPQGAASRPGTPSRHEPSPPARGAAREVDLHGLTVEEALVRIDEALNAALLADAAELRFVHGRSGGRLRAALHRRLAAIPSVRSFRVDPRNAGVTIAVL